MKSTGKALRRREKTGGKPQQGNMCDTWGKSSDIKPRGYKGPGGARL
jgi:hypothetical protein